MLPKTLMTFAACLTLRWSIGDRLTTISTGSVMLRRILDTIILPLLSSACCGLQLLMNALAIGGCAGFNTYLGPLRPYFLGLFMSTVLVVSYQSVSPLRLTGQLLLAFLPELVHLYNLLMSTRYRPRNSTMTSNNNHPATTSLLPPPSMLPQVVELVIPDMGCVACIQKINSSLRKIPGVTFSNAWLEDRGGGKAKVEYMMMITNPQDKHDMVSQQEGMMAQFVRAVQDAGFHVDPMNNTLVE